MALVTLDEMKTALGLGSTENEQNAKINQAIPEADKAIAAYTGRDFAVTPTSGAGSAPTPRTYRTTLSGLVEVDDFQHGTVSSVLLGTTALEATAYVVEPASYEYPVGYWIELLRPGRATSPEMGFTRNEDVYWSEHRWITATTIEVTALWGWPSVPTDVKRAAIWTVAAFMERPSPYVSESIAGLSRTQANPMTHAIPRRAQSLLDPHTKGAAAT